MIREATRDDIPQLVRLWRALEEAQAEFRILPTRADAQARAVWMFEQAIETDGDAVLVIDDDGVLLGMAVVEVEQTGPHSLAEAVVCELSRVVVAPQSRGQGLGAQLIAAAEAFGRARGANWLSARMFSGNEAGRAFWVAEGFVPRYEQRVRPIEDGPS